MFTNIENVKECIIYPGTYTAAPEKEELFENNQIPRNSTFNKAIATIKEKENIYQLLIEIEATDRNEITLQVDDIILFISVIHKTINNEQIEISSRNDMIITNYLILPKDADTEFMSAEFSNGVLKLHIPKRENAIISHIKEIIVY